MRVVFFVHSLVSDWNHSSAHFLRGVASELVARGHEVRVFEPRTSLQDLLSAGGEVLTGFRAAYPTLASQRYDAAVLDLDRELSGARLVIVHERNDPALVRRIGRHRREGGAYRLLFYDTHHRSAVRAPDLADFDGVLAAGAALRDLYGKRGWAGRAWTWPEAADVRVFYPRGVENREGEVVWLGNWEDGARAAALREYLTGPVRELGLFARVYGPRFPEAGLRALAEAAIDHAGWVPNYEVPRLFARFAVTLHLPRRLSFEAHPSTPSILAFEALACGIPLISAPWEDRDGLFRAGQDYLMAHNGEEMKLLLRDLLHDPAMAAELARSGREALLSRHTCRHRVNELMEIEREIREGRS
ncbi:MAG TPA: glycosyltransferase [Thermoanaerobaculia bacterium]|nr:glycosyltransferase [Thermoanaerobaculia bacterium]